MANNLGTLTLDLVAKIGGFTQSMDRAASATEKSMKQIADATNKAKSTITSLFSLAVGGYTLKGLADLADSYGQMADRIKAVTSSTEEYTQVQQRLLQTANATYRPLQEAQELYIRTSDTLKNLGYNTEQALDITDSFSYLLVTNAASADRANSAINALSKSIQTGKVDSQSWQTILAAMPSLINSIAESSGKSADEIRQLGIQGKLSLQDLLEAYRNTVDGNKQLADAMGTTINDALVKFKNNLAAFIGEANRANGVTQLLANVISELGNNIDLIASAAFVALAGKIGAMTASMVGATAATINNTRATIQNALADRESTAAKIQSLTATSRQSQALAMQAQQITLNARLREMETRGTVQHVAALNALATARRNEIAANLKAVEATRALNTAQSASVGITRSLLGILGGPVGIGVTVASIAAGWLLFRDNTNEAKVSLDAMTGTLDEVRKKLDEMTVSQASAFKLGIDNKIKELKDQQQETIRQIGEAITARTATIDTAGIITYNQDILQAVANLKELAATGGDTAAAINELRANFGNIIPEDVLDKLTASAGRIDDLKAESKTLAEQSQAASDRLKNVADSAINARDAVQGIFAVDPSQAKEYQKILEQLDDRIISLADSTGMLALQEKLRKAGAAEGTKEWDVAIQKQQEAIDLQNRRSSSKSAIKSENDLEKSYQSQLDTLRKQLVVIDDKSQATKLAYELENSELAKLTESQKETLRTLASEIDLRNEVAEAVKKQAEQQEWINTLNEQVANRQKQADLDVFTTGMGSRQAEELREVIAVQEQYAKKQQELAKSLGTPNGLTQQEYQQRTNALRQAQETEVAIVQDAQKRKREAEQSWLNGTKAGLQTYVEDAGNIAKQTQSLFTNAFSNMESALVSFVVNGKASFSDFAKSLLSDIATIGIRIASSNILMGLFGNLFGNYAGASAGLDSIIGGSGLFAKGGAFSGGVQAFANGGAFTNSIINKPTLFPFAKGTGLMGEAGPEAIMPLTRTADGSLGVRAIADMNSSSNTDRPQVNIVINNDGSGGVQSTQNYEAIGQEMYRQIQQIADDRIFYQKRQGGLLDPNSRRNQ